MHKLFARPSAAFQPPSDMVGDGGGSSNTKKIFIGLGIGCGIILIIIGILFAAGAFQAVSCCTQVKGIAQNSVAAERFAQGFAAELHDGKFDEAYARTSADYKGKVDRAGFDAAIAAHRARLAAAQPRVLGVQMNQDDASRPSIKELAESGSWTVTYQYAGATDDEMLVLVMEVIKAPEGAEAPFFVDGMVLDVRTRNLQAEPPAVEVLEVHSLLQRSQYDRAYMRLGQGFRDSTDRDAWRKFLDETGGILTSSQLEIREVSYSDTEQQATVMAHARTATGENAIVQFELRPIELPEEYSMPGLAWRVVSIAPILAQDAADGAPAVDPVPAEAPDAGSAAD